MNERDILIERDREEREKASSETKNNCWVEASAGTGKTSILLKRIINIIQEDKELKMDELVAITFTELASVELKTRLREELERRISLVEPEQEKWQRFYDALENLERAQISTIHSFCSRLIHLKPLEAGLSPQFEQMDEFSARLLNEELWQEWLEEKIENDSPLLALLKYSGVRLDAFREFCFEIFDYRELLETLELMNPLSSLEVLAKELERVFFESYQTAREACNKPERDKFVRELNSIAMELEKSTGYEKKLKILLGKKIEEQDDAPTYWKQGFSRREISRQLKKKMGDLVVGFLLPYVQEFLLKIEKAKQEREVLDFNDLLIKARDLLLNKDVRKYLQKKFKYILIDEFQDTDPLQVEIAFLLAELEPKAKNWTEVELRKGKLFLVGDPKQSIYHFRRADIEIYEEAKRVFGRTRDAKFNRLYLNRRTVSSIIDWVNYVFNSSFIEKEYIQPSYQPLVEERKNLNGYSSGVIILSIQSDKEDAKVKDVREMEASCVAEFIKKAVNKFPVHRKEQQAQRLSDKLQYGDIAILYPKGTDIEIYQNEFMKRGIPFQTQGRGQFTEREEFQGLIAVLKAIENPMDEVSVVGALRSIYFGLSDDEILYCSQKGIKFNYLLEPEFTEPKNLILALNFLKELHNDRNKKPLAYLIEKLIKYSSLRHFYGFDTRTSQMVSNLEKLSNWARVFDTKLGASLAGFINWLDGLEKLKAEEPDMPFSEGGEYVTFLTIHKSKGLEFPMVILVNLMSKLKSPQPNFIPDFRKKALGIKFGNFYNSEYEELEVRSNEYQRAEQIRLMYVSATRARDWLVIPDPRKIYKTTENSYLEIIAGGLPSDETEDKINKLVSVFYIKPELYRSKQGKNESLFELEQANPKEVKKFVEERENWTRENEESIEKATTALKIITPSSLKEWEKEVELKPTLEPARAIGKIIHRAIELVPKEELEKVLEIAKVLAIEEGLDEKTRNEILELLENCVHNPEFKKLFEGKIYREIPFVFREKAALYRGSIDLVRQTELGLELVDFKTDRIKGKDIKEHSRIYIEQMEVYRKALSKSSSLKIKSIFLYYLRENLRAKIE